MKKAASIAPPQQGVSGQVLWLEGNLMPGPGASKASGKPIEREILFYEKVKLRSLQSANGLYQEIPTKLVGTTKSNDEGMFAISLPVGSYSVFVKEAEGFFANSFDGQGFVNVVKVQEDTLTEMSIKVNYKAAY